MDLRRDHRFNPFSPSPEHQAILESAPDMDLDGVDYSDPSTIARLTGMPAPPTMEPADLQRQARGMSEDIFHNHGLLQEILYRHEATIQKRWSKKTRPQKLKILLDAWPNMAVDHRPDFQTFRNKQQYVRLSGTSLREHFVWPYINQEDLAKPKTLLLLLNSRGRQPPSDFAAADIESMHLGIVTFAIRPVFLNCYVLVLNGATNPAEYGKLLAWDDHPEAFDWMHTRKQFLPGEGLLVLEAQQRLMKFLVKCCQSILHDIPADDLVSAAYPVLPEPTLKTEGETNGFEALTVMAAEAPYRVPARLDYSRLTSLLDAKASAAEDHLWALREDPSYFTETLLDWRDHRQEMLPDLNGDAHPVTSRVRSNTLWTRVIGTALSEAYLQLEVFTELSRQARGLQSLQAKYATVISPSKDLPGEYLGALLKFRYYLEQTAKGPLNHLKQPPPDTVTPMIAIMSRPSVKMNKTEEHVLWLLRTLWEDDHNLFLVRFTIIMDELDRLINSEPTAKEMIAAHVASTIADLSIIAQCMHQLELYQPWANGFETQDLEYSERHKKAYSEQSTNWSALVVAFRTERSANADKIVQLGNPSGGRFDYPVGKRRTLQNVDKMRQAEADLDAFWENIDTLMNKRGTRVEGTAVGKLLSQGRVLQRTPEWVEPPKAENPAVSKASSEAEVDMLLTRPFSTFYSRTEPNRPVVHPQTSKKVKTHGTPNAASSREEEQGNQADTISDQQPTFEVDARAFKTFRTLFYNPKVTSTPGEIPWTDFLHALASTGFVAEKLYGSVWQFRPTRLDVERSIQFHEPHPRGRIPFTVARRHGRRLSRTYRW
ncbi:hypothetical protein KVR01_010443 [Diaporthe batatas]|uniref:uncharacterized protein n=1 Tax=Diaporthe batatas TaxID=748121 RepID=UPI001D0571C6|nr:uncharacterized protein KVR01_010443 [Diaporthe batatas]KAG8159806.1 hypothetical protein KVR01_010443 [Diaporthe batatas]